MNKKIFWLAGEKSGDLHGSMALENCRKKHPEWKHIGVGGKRMQKAGLKCEFPFEKFNVMGFWEVLKQIRFFAKIEKDIIELLKTEKPDVIVLIDYPGLNMRIAKKAKALGFKVLYYICPQFWAWKKHRIFQLGEFTDAIGYILPFEGDFFEEHGIKANYTGHPISEEIEVQSSREEFAKLHGLNVNRKWVGFFPGSRDGEVRKLMPNYLQAIKKIEDNCEIEFLVSKSDSVSEKLFNGLIKNFSAKNLYVINHNNYEMMKHCDFLCVTSGTATLETAYLGTPFIICYRTSLFNYVIGRYLVKIERIGLPNIVLNKDIVPELIQQDASPEKIASNVSRFLSDKSMYETVKEDLKYLHDLLGKKSAAVEVTDMIEALL